MASRSRDATHAGALPLLPLREKLSAERTDEGDASRLAQQPIAGVPLSRPSADAEGHPLPQGERAFAPRFRDILRLIPAPETASILASPLFTEGPDRDRRVSGKAGGAADQLPESVWLRRVRKTPPGRLGAN